MAETSHRRLGPRRSGRVMSAMATDPAVRAMKADKEEENLDEDFVLQYQRLLNLIMPNGTIVHVDRDTRDAINPFHMEMKPCNGPMIYKNFTSFIDAVQYIRKNLNNYGDVNTDMKPLEVQILRAVIRNEIRTHLAENSDDEARRRNRSR